MARFGAHLLDFVAFGVAEASKVVQRHTVDVGCIVPLERQRLGYREPPLEPQAQADAVLGEIGEGDDRLVCDPERLPKEPRAIESLKATGRDAGFLCELFESLVYRRL